MKNNTIVRELFECEAPKCRAAATKLVSHRFLTTITVQVCGRHLAFAKQKCERIANS